MGFAKRVAGRMGATTKDVDDITKGLVYPIHYEVSDAVTETFLKGEDNSLVASMAQLKDKKDAISETRIIEKQIKIRKVQMEEKIVPLADPSTSTTIISPIIDLDEPIPVRAAPIYKMKTKARKSMCIMVTHSFNH